jgi:hypothetical protein
MVKKVAAGGETLSRLSFRPPTVGEMKLVSQRSRAARAVTYSGGSNPYCVAEMRWCRYMLVRWFGELMARFNAQPAAMLPARRHKKAPASIETGRALVWGFRPTYPQARGCKLLAAAALNAMRLSVQRFRSPRSPCARLATALALRPRS